MIRRIFTFLILGWLLTSCVPDVYLIDRQTVLELEASGDWPELDKEFQKKQLSAGPLPLEKTEDAVEKRQIFTMTHADQEVKPTGSK